MQNRHKHIILYVLFLISSFRFLIDQKTHTQTRQPHNRTWISIGSLPVPSSQAVPGSEFRVPDSVVGARAHNEICSLCQSQNGILTLFSRATLHLVVRFAHSSLDFEYRVCTRVRANAICTRVLEIFWHAELWEKYWEGFWYVTSMKVEVCLIIKIFFFG